MVANSAADDAMSNATKSFMCITDASSSANMGGYCMEGEIGASENTVKTYYLTVAEIATKLTAPWDAYAWSDTGDGMTYTLPSVD